VEVGFRVAVNGVPRDGDCLAEEPEGHGPRNRLLDAVAGLSDAVGFGFMVGGLDRPATVVAGDQLGSLRACASASVEASATSKPSLRPGLRIKMTLTGRV